MNTLSCARAVVLLLAAWLCGCGGGNPLAGGASSGDLAIGRMKVAVMPEYDDPGVLAIYDGRFEEPPSYPIKTSFLIPGGSVISDACSLSPGGQHFCQLYKTVNRGELDEVSLLLPYPNFYLSFHTPRLEASGEAKSFDYLVKANHAIRVLEVDVQQPLRSAEFTVAAREGGGISARSSTINQGFTHVVFRLDGVAKGQENAFRISYRKSDRKPSVDIKFSSMAGAQAAAPYEAPRNVRTWLYALFATGVVSVAAVGAWFLRARKKKRG